MAGIDANPCAHLHCVLIWAWRAEFGCVCVGGGPLEDPTCWGPFRALQCQLARIPQSCCSCCWPGVCSFHGSFFFFSFLPVAIIITYLKGGVFWVKYAGGHMNNNTWHTQLLWLSSFNGCCLTKFSLTCWTHHNWKRINFGDVASYSDIIIIEMIPFTSSYRSLIVPLTQWKCSIDWKLVHAFLLLLQKSLHMTQHLCGSIRDISCVTVNISIVSSVLHALLD